MNPIQESKQELEAAIRYAENAIASANQTIESIATSQEQTGREQALEEQNNHLHKEVTRLENENKELRSEKVATMPVIPKAVAIAIFREGMAYGASRVCEELDEATYIRIEESEYVGDFHVTFERDIDLSDHLDTDWLRGRTDEIGENFVLDRLSNLCADNKFECRIHGIDSFDQEEKKEE